MNDDAKTVAMRVVSHIRKSIKVPDKGGEWLIEHARELAAIKLEIPPQSVSPEIVVCVQRMLRAKWWPVCE